jgi:cbb3-type cytochrome oxidase maturation protein
MSVILIMLPAALVLAGLGVWAFIMAAKKGQFDDLDTPAIRAVFDDDEYPQAKRKEEHHAPSSTDHDDRGNGPDPERV